MRFESPRIRVTETTGIESGVLVNSTSRLSGSYEKKRKSKRRKRLSDLAARASTGGESGIGTQHTKWMQTSKESEAVSQPHLSLL